MVYKMGIDIGSTTVKIIILNERNEIIYRSYDRHLSQVRAKTAEIIEQAKDIAGIDSNSGEIEIKVKITGSAGQGVAQACGFEFVQEVFVTGEMVRRYYPETDCAIELGGEDAKIIFFTGGAEERMNGSCAGGTGAFIDQMSLLLDVSNEELDKLSLKADKIYTIASRCGVFAKSDIQPLLNQGAKKENIAASIFQAVVDQTITGLAQGREIKGSILFLGGPLYFFRGLRKRFTKTLKLSENSANFPEIAPYAVALGAAVSADESGFLYKYGEITELLKKSVNLPGNNIKHTESLFADEEEYNRFKARHSRQKTTGADINKYAGGAYLGIDCGSTTTKIVLTGENHEILYSYYAANAGNPVDIILGQLKYIRKLCGDKIDIKSSAVTGYGEDLIKNAFDIDSGIVETVAHFKAAEYFNPKVNFILDIGGQDIKCFKIKNNAIDNIMLNEACSSGCGSFIESFAKSMGYAVENFCREGIYAKNPVDLGSRCTVFMNSSVKQAQKEGASIGDISAGLSMSVVKNALYKVIRIHDASELGENIVVQGGTFLNDAILRAFEKAIGREVTRPDISGLMGAFGCALYAKEKYPGNISSLLSSERLDAFTHSSQTSNCGLCANKCGITINKFSENKKYISGNKCERPLGISRNENLPNMYEFKLDYIKNIIKSGEKFGSNGKTIGIPLGLNFYETLPFWHSLWSNLGFNVEVSDISSRKLYRSGQQSIPSDTICYPAKLMHGHIENLISRKISDIFYPCMTYNFDEKISDNNYNCPVVAYYPELLKSNMSGLYNINFMTPYFDISNKRLFAKRFAEYLKILADSGRFDFIDKKVIKKAISKAYRSQDLYFKSVYSECRRAVKFADENNLKLIVLCGRPYHIDPEINHGIDKALNSLGCVIITEEAASASIKTKPETKVLNQWTYHARLYNAARFAAGRKNAEFVQLVSFGCGIDAITSDEARDILERSSKLYTQIKIDEINNLGAAKIRIRSMLAVTGE
ncbi:MAG: acyl-CoA dehydratase activase [Oscillospiraceae bacterium]|nr:acyl-CoA dehydratase activase [Oscillospiraceae bacterium]